MKKLLQSAGVLFLALICAIVLWCNTALFRADAESVSAETVEQTQETLHRESKIYSSQNSPDYYSGCDDTANYNYNSAEMTILTHGLSSEAAVWSNAGKEGEFAYCEDSLIADIGKRTEFDLYLADCKGVSAESDNESGFCLSKVDPADYLNRTETDCITDVSKHIVVVYQSAIAGESNQAVYEEFHKVVDTLSLQYKALSGRLPILNLVGHSRGGLTNIEYATEHPYNVTSVYSLGTPYNGSVLGQMYGLLKILEYINPDGSVKEGAASILDSQEAIRLRDGWNAVCTADDVHIKVVAYASMASCGFLKSFLVDLENYKEEYTYIANVKDVFNTIVDTMDSDPKKGGLLLELANAFLKVGDAFRYDWFGDDATNEELRNALKLIEKINGQYVLMDDLFIDANSQLGMGFSDEIEYRNFTHYAYIFKDSDMSDHRAKPSSPAVVHNLETMNGVLTSDISNLLKYGHSEELKVLHDEESGEIGKSEGKALRFFADANGNRTFTAQGATIELYQENADNLTALRTAEDTLTFDFTGGKNYVFVLKFHSGDSGSYLFELSDCLNVADNQIELSGNETHAFVLTVPTNGYYRFVPDSVNVKVSLDKNATANEYYYLKSSKVIVHCTNQSAASIVCKLSVLNVGQVYEGENIKIIDSQKVVSFTNPYSYSVKYELSLNWINVDQSSLAGVNVVNQDNASIVKYSENYISDRTKKIGFELGGGDSCYILIPVNGTDVSAIIRYNEEYVQWTIDGYVYRGSVEYLSRGRTYTIRAYYYINGNHVKEITDFGHLENDNNNKYKLNGNSLFIKNTATIGGEIFIYSSIYRNNLIHLVIAPNESDITFRIISVAGSLYLKWDCNFELTELEYSINDKSFDISKNPIPLSKLSRFCIVTKAYSPSFPGINLAISSPLRSSLGSGYTVNELFGGGEGVPTYPYLIKNEEQLNNIRYQHYVIHHPTDGNVDWISSYFKLDANITLSSDWTPIETEFYGELDGGGYTISNLHIEVPENVSDVYLGMFCKAYSAVIKNITFANCSINVPASSSIFAGIVAGSDFSARYINVKLEKPKINCDNAASCIGGFAGSSSSSFEQCAVIDCDFVSYGNILGTMFGFGTGCGIYDSSCSGKLTIKAYNDTKFVGNYYGKGSAHINAECQNSVKIDYQQECIAAGTLITLADGRQVPVEALTGNEMLLVWNLQTGSFDTAPILFIDSDPLQKYKVINLAFSDGTSVKVIYEHGFWDYDLNQYVYLREDAARYVGHWFNKQTLNENGGFISEKVQLTGVVVQEEYTTAYSPVTYGHLCYYVNGMLSMPGGIGGLFNTFEVDSETMRYDASLMQADIEEYGLFTYEEFASLVPVSEEVFGAFNGQYLKVAIGKGMITIDELQRLAIRYQEFF